MNALKFSLLKLFRPPITYEGDVFEKSKYIMAYRMMLFLSLMLFFLLGVLILFFHLVYGITIAIGLIASISCFFYIYKTGKYKGVMLVFNLLGAVLCIGTLYLIPNIPHLVDGLWMLVGIVFAVYSVGWRLGAFFAFIHACAISYWYLFLLKDHTAILKNLTTLQIASDAANVFVCFGIIYYLIWQNVRASKTAQAELEHARLSLQSQYDMIYQQNEEKSVLIKEIHHRVKNNLQVIISLLRLQSRELEGSKEIGKFEESINRISTMALIHEKIYQNEDLSHIELEDYFQTLANDFLSTYDLSEHVETEIVCRVAPVSLNAIVPLALIFNELVTNSLKYAFKNQEAARITLRFTEENGFLHFYYADNGAWIAPQRNNSFGLELIETLNEQLNGRMERLFDQGTIYHFYFEKLNA